jgi:uncharacterized protein
LTTYLAPGVYREVVDRGGLRIVGIRTDIAAFIGICERGPVHAPAEVNSWEQYTARFGGFVANGCLAYAIKGFFDNGGATCFVVRVAAPRATTTANPAAPPLRAASTVLSTEGFAPGAAVTIRQGERSVEQLVQDVDAVGRRLVWEGGLDQRFDLGPASPALAFETGASPASAVLLDGLGRATVRVEAASPGSWGNRLSVRATRSFEPDSFSLAVYLDGAIQELFSRLTLVRGGDDYAEAATAGSRLIRILDLGSSSPYPSSLPDPGRAGPGRGPLRLGGGRDGVAALTPRDFIGAPGAATRRGLRLLELVDEVALVAAPDLVLEPRPAALTAPGPPPEIDECLPAEPVPAEAPPAGPAIVERKPAFSPAQIALAQRAIAAHCEAERDRFALLDVPLLTARLNEVDVEAIRDWRGEFDSTFAALFYPWLLVPDPLRLDGQVVRAVPPSGHVAGIYARTDLERGVHEAPANALVDWAQAVAAAVPAEVQGLLNPIGVNCVRAFPGRGIRLYGARTASSAGQWRYVNVRRLLLMIEEAVETSIQWAVFEANDFYLRQTLVASISTFLADLWGRGALAGASEEEAFFVKCDAENNPPALAQLGQLVIDVGVAPVRPAEFVIFRVGRTETELQILEGTG